jgi:hypothetical protein
MWSRQTNFEEGLSKEKRVGSWSGVARQARGEGFGKETCQKCRLGPEEDSKSSPAGMPKCYSTSCRLGKAQPNHKASATTMGILHPMSP